MIIDGLLLFSGTSNGAAGGITTALNPYGDLPTTGTQVASNIIDLGVKLGIPSYALGAGARDMGIGDDPSLKLTARCTTAFTAGTTIQLTLSGAPDSGTGTEGSYTIYWTSPAYAAATAIAGAELCNIDLPRVLFGTVLPRFLKLSYITTSSNSAGIVVAGIVVDRDDQVIGTTGAMSGYQAGINIAN